VQSDTDTTTEELYTDKPHLYATTALKARLIPVIASLPEEFLHVLTEERNVAIEASPIPPGVSEPHPDEIWQDDMSRAIAKRPLPVGKVTDYRRWRATTEPTGWLVLLGRDVMERADDEAFFATVLHELCHVYLKHDADLPNLDDKEWKRIENEAVALACDLGFRDKEEVRQQWIRQSWGDSVQVGDLPGDAP